MFDIGWSEILVVGVLALLVVGPKDLPKVVQGIVKAVRYLRGISAEIFRQMEDISEKTGLSDLKEMSSSTWSPLEDADRPVAKQRDKASIDRPAAAVDQPDLPEPIYDHSVFLGKEAQGTEEEGNGAEIGQDRSFPSIETEKQESPKLLPPDKQTAAKSKE